MSVGVDTTSSSDALVLMGACSTQIDADLYEGSAEFGEGRAGRPAACYLMDFRSTWRATPPIAVCCHNGEV